jgi:DNA helicase-2/ATP-dependent DNA helicase PcrA
LISRQGARIRRSSQSRLDTYSSWSLPSAPGSSKGNHAKILEPKYKSGMRVRHESWGEGMVVDVRIQDDEERLDVFFDSVGFKRLLASMAKLEILKYPSKT